MLILNQVLVVFFLNIISLQHRDAMRCVSCNDLRGSMRCGYIEDLSQDETSLAPFGQAIQKHVKDNDKMDMVHCHCTDKYMVVKHWRRIQT